MIWFVMIRYDIIWYDKIWYVMISYHIIWCVFALHIIRFAITIIRFHIINNDIKRNSIIWYYNRLYDNKNYNNYMNCILTEMIIEEE